ncbi:UDP-glucuronosyltransferase 1-1 [Homalodisca vitripennis]|nr:UDP-glucuronosyltransferase 1-1 [Homalodisca vitripennis]
MQATLLWATLLSIITNTFSARILAILPFPGRSHQIFHSSVLRALAQRGHEIVEYSPFPPNKPIANYTHIEIHTSAENLFDNLTYEEIERQLPRGSVFGLAALRVWEFSNIICEDTFQQKNIRKLIESKDHFDLVITASTFDSILVFGHKFNAPTIVSQAFAYYSTMNREAGNALSIATVPDSLSFLFMSQMTFVERLQNFISVSLTLFYYYSFQLAKQDAIIKKYYQYPGTPNAAKMVSDVSLILLNVYPPLDSQPYTPNIVPIGGISVASDRVVLPQSLHSESSFRKPRVFRCFLKWPCHLLNPIPAQPHQPSGESGARIGKQSFAECLSLVTLPPQAVCLPGPFVYTLDTIDFGLKYGAVPTQTAAKGSSRRLTKHSISSSTLNKRAIRVPDKALSYCWDVILRFPLISGVEVNREWLIEYELRSHCVGDHFENSAWVYSFSDGAMARVRRAIPPQASNHQPIS